MPDDRVSGRPCDDPDHVQSLGRGLAVLRAFGPDRETLTIAEAAQATGLTRAGARRILLTLRDLGYVSEIDRAFALTAKVLELGYAYFSSRSIWTAARPVLQALADEINETVSIGVLDDTEIIYVLRVPSSRVLQLGLSAGSRLPAHVSSMGRVLLAALPDHVLYAYLQRAPLRKYTKYTITDPRVLRARLEEVRTQGWAYVKGEIEEGVSGISVPLRDQEDGLIGALNVSTASERASSQEVRKVIVPRLREACRGILLAHGSTRIGGMPV